MNLAKNLRVGVTTNAGTPWEFKPAFATPSKPPSPTRLFSRP